MSQVAVRQSQVEAPNMIASVFPLPLSHFEYYMFIDDRPSHPMVFVMVVHVDGCLLREPFETAVRETLETHPLFMCHVKSVPGRGCCWVPQKYSDTTVRWRSSHQAAQFNDPVTIRPIDLTTQTGLQIEVSHSAQESRIIFYLHHACCDGIGGLQVVGDVLARYGIRTAADGSRAPSVEPSQVAALLRRDHFDTGRSATERQQRSSRRLLGKITRLFGRKPFPLYPIHSAARHNQEDHAVSARAIQSCELPRTVNQGLRLLAAQKGVTVNDLCIREMLLQVEDWNRRAVSMSGNPWLRISVPVSMRTAEHQGMPACNLVSYSFVTRRVSECRDPDELLKSIHRQTEEILFQRSGIVALRFIGLLRKIPGAVRLMLKLKSCFCTAVLANIGDVRRRYPGRFPLLKGRWVAGNVVVQRISGVAPVRPNTRAAVTIGEYGGTMSIHIRTDATVFSDEDSEQFLKEFSGRLEALVVGVRDPHAAPTPEGNCEH